MTNRILLIGANGMLGTYLYKYLAKLFDVIPTCFSNYNSHSNYIYLDITNIDSIKSVFSLYKPNIVINCAAFTNVDLAESNRKSCQNLNSSSLSKIISNIHKNTYLVHFSTDYVFDGKEGFYNEESLTNPINFYGKTKLEAENLIRGQLKHFIIFRPNVLFTNNLNDSNFFSWVVNSLNKNKVISVTNEQYSNPTYIPFFIKSVYTAIILRYEGILHYGSENSLNRYDFAKEIAQHFSLDAKLIKPVNNAALQQSAKRPIDSSLDTKKIVNDLNIDIFSTSYILNNIKLR
tara:strand:- start:93 stop:962 length:870 start_codon:yes stop_codon:yes gene_type:complete